MKKPAKAVPAATILMLRDGPDGLEVFMVVRHHQIDFASGALVFPGGKVDDSDLAVRELCDGVADADDTHCALMVGAIREAFEECGILLARKNGESGLISGELLAELDQFRHPLHKGEKSIGDFLAENNLRLACDSLQRFAHWITPETMPRRFDTHFYLAAAPGDHLATHDGHESVDSVWVTPRAALKGSDDGTYTIIFPTRLNVELLGESSTVAAAMSDAARRKLVPVMPWMEKRDDGRYICIPPEAPYPVSEEKISEKTLG